MYLICTWLIFPSTKYIQVQNYMTKVYIYFGIVCISGLSLHNNSEIVQESACMCERARVPIQKLTSGYTVHTCQISNV